MMRVRAVKETQIIDVCTYLQYCLCILMKYHSCSVSIPVNFAKTPHPSSHLSSITKMDCEMYYCDT